MSRKYIAELADTSEADVAPLIRDFVVAALESRGNNRLTDPDTDDTITRIFIDTEAWGTTHLVHVYEDVRVTRDAERPLLFTLSIAFPGEASPGPIG